MESERVHVRIRALLLYDALEEGRAFSVHRSADVGPLSISAEVLLQEVRRVFTPNLVRCAGVATGILISRHGEIHALVILDRVHGRAAFLGTILKGAGRALLVSGWLQECSVSHQLSGILILLPVYHVALAVHAHFLEQNLARAWLQPQRLVSVVFPVLARHHDV